MSHRLTGQLGFSEAVLSGGTKASRHLQGLSDAVDWRPFRDLLSDIYGSARGRPAYPPLVLFKCLLVQQWYGLSDPGLEEALEDRLSFRRFAGLSLEDPVPDHSTLSRFRKRLAERSLGEVLFDELARQFEARGLIVKQGTLIDATLVKADARPPRKGETASSDRDAKWGVKRSGPLFGYKAHVSLDQGSGLIRRAILTTANVSDRTPAADLIMGDEAVVYGDKGYCGWWLRDRLAEAGVGDGIMRSNYRRRPLSDEDRQRNREIAKIRGPVERAFAVMKRWYGYNRVRYRSLQRNALQLHLMCMAINLRRARALIP